MLRGVFVGTSGMPVSVLVDRAVASLRATVSAKPRPKRRGGFAAMRAKAKSKSKAASGFQLWNDMCGTVKMAILTTISDLAYEYVGAVAVLVSSGHASASAPTDSAVNFHQVCCSLVSNTLRYGICVCGTCHCAWLCGHADAHGDGSRPCRLAW